MFERFTARARRVLVAAQEEARGLGHPYLGTEHLLLGLLDDGDSLAVQALTDLGVDPAACRQRLLEICPSGNEPVRGGVAFTPRSKKVLELSLRQALSMKHNYIGTEHLLLGLLKEDEGIAAQALRQMGLDDPARAQQCIERLLADPEARKTPEPPVDPALTPAARALARGAQRNASPRSPVSSVDYLLAILDDERSLAAKVLASFGVTRDAVVVRAGDMGAAGTSDEVPQFLTEVTGSAVTIRIEDPAVAERVRKGELVLRFEAPGPPGPTAGPGPITATGT